MSIRADIHIPLLPSGVGSVSGTDPVEAVSQILERYWRLPFWPQLPNRDPHEMMIPQFGLSLPGASWDADANILRWAGDTSDAALDAADLPPPDRAAGLHEFLARLEAIPADDRAAIAKGQLPGPLTLSMAMRDADGHQPHEDPETLIWLGRFLGRMGAAQAQAFQRLGMKACILFDEPALAYVDEPSLPISWRDANDALRAALEPVQQLGAIAGLHCCQPPNWTRALQSRPSMIHFDATEGRVDDVVEHKSAIREHVSRGGYLGWGLWPTEGPQPEPFDSKEHQYYLARAARDLSFVDASVGLIFKRSLLSGACGSAGLAAEAEATMAQDLEDLSMGIRRRYWIAATTDVDPDDPLT
jgi:hypothetical protein